MAMSAPYSNIPENEIGLMELMQILFRRKLLIGLSCALGVLSGLAYCLLATPRYAVEVYVDKPLDSDIAALNLDRNAAIGLPPFTPEQVFPYFTNQFRSELALQNFFREVYMPTLAQGERNAPDAAFFDKIKQEIKIIKPDPKGRELLGLRIEANTGEKAARFATEFISLVARDAANALVVDVRNNIELLVRHTEQDLAEKRAVTARERQDRLVQLSEALQVAEAVSVREPQVTSGRLPAQDRLAPFIDGSQLYARGAKSLAAELSVLRVRQSDDPFIQGLRESESRLRTLKAINLDPKTFKVFRADGEITAPLKPEAPKKIFVLILAAVIGAIGGVMLALFVEFQAGARRSTHA